MPLYRLWFFISWLVIHCLPSVYTLDFDLPEADSDLIGELQWIQALDEDSFTMIGRRYGVGYHEIMEANPKIDSEKIEKGTIIVLPTRFILPSPARKGIVVNLGELRLYYYDENNKKVYTYPVGIGRAGWETPVGLSYVLGKLTNPVWHVPKSIQEASKQDGILLPDRVLPGADNPLGAYALRLHYHNYLIHGTSDLEGVGRRSTAGCIRMFPEDIKELFSHVSKGTVVNIVHEPYKLGRDNQKILHVESHLPLNNSRFYDNHLQKSLTRLTSHRIGQISDFIDASRVERVLEEKKGIPICVTHHHLLN